MNAEPATKRRKLARNCVQCQQYKGSCDRTRPSCSSCVRRKVLCSYEGSKSSISIKSKSSARTRTGTASLSAVLAVQVGYSSNDDSNNLTGLLKQNDDEIVVTGLDRPLSAKSRQRYIELVENLPTPLVLRQLLDAYFNDINWFFLTLERYFLEKALTEWYDHLAKLRQGLFHSVPRETIYLPALLFQTLAVSLQLLPNDTDSSTALTSIDAIDREDLSEEYSNSGAEVMIILGRHKSAVVAVEADLMRALWMKNASRGTEAWYCLGEAIRQGQDLGLHRQTVKNVEFLQDDGTCIKLWYDEKIRRLWSMLFVWDAHMSWMLGRPPSIHSIDCTTLPPTDCEFPQNPTCDPPLAQGTQDPATSYRVHIFQRSMAQLMSEMLAQGATNRHLRDYEAVQLMHKRAQDILNELPSSLNPEMPNTEWDAFMPRLTQQRYHIASTFHCFLTALHRPYCEQNRASRGLAINAAMKCLEAQQGFFQHVESRLHKLYFLAFYTIDSSMFLLGLLAHGFVLEPDILTKIDALLRQSMNRLSVLADVNVMAKSGVTLIKTHYEKTKQDTEVRLTRLPDTQSDAYKSLDQFSRAPLQRGTYGRTTASSRYW